MSPTLTPIISQIDAMVDGVPGWTPADQLHALFSLAYSSDVEGDIQRVEQIFGNLIGNGLKFNQSENPRIAIGVSAQGGARVRRRV